MTYTIAITSQGQMSLPATIRKLVGFSQPGTATVRIQGDGVFIKPTRDIVSLAGILHDKIKLPHGYDKMSTQEIIDAEKKSYKNAVVKHYEKSLHRR